VFSGLEVEARRYEVPVSLGWAKIESCCQPRRVVEWAEERFGVLGRLQEGNRWRCSLVLVCCAAGIAEMGRGESEEDGWTGTMNTCDLGPNI
jgi:hypothetical protein